MLVNYQNIEVSFDTIHTIRIDRFVNKEIISVSFKTIQTFGISLKTFRF